MGRNGQHYPISCSRNLLRNLLGLFVGLARLSNNWLVKKVGAIFVETLRNIPLLVQILLYGAILANLGDLQFDSGWDNWVIWSNKGVSIPRVFIADGFYQWAVFMIFGALAARYVYNRRSQLNDKTGQDTFPWAWSQASVLARQFLTLDISYFL